MHPERAEASPRSDSAFAASDVRAVHRKVIGRYEVLFPIAKGGMGSVLAARAPAGNIVAVKLMSEADTSEDAISAFRREARVTETITHPNVVKTLDFGEQEGLPYLVMELVEGVSVGQLLRAATRQKIPFAPELAAYLVRETARGLHAAHSLTDATGKPIDLVHRDVSPQNILVGYDGGVRVTDFGIAKLSTATYATATGLVKGKFSYMSPEQTRAEPLDRRSDVFSLGIVLQELLTQKRLFPGESPAQIVLDVLSRDAEPASDIRPEVPRALADVALRCLIKSPAGRYASAAEVADALDEAMTSTGRRAGPTELAEWMSRVFGSEQRAFRERIAIAQTDPPSTSRAVAVEASAHSVEEARGVPSPVKGARVALGFIALALVAGGAIATTKHFTGARAPSSPEASVTAAATTTKTEEAPPSAPASATSPVASASSNAPGTSAEAPRGSGARPATRPATHRGSPKTTAPTTSSSGSKPLRFDTL